ncbi:MAG: hypothetical protein H0W67_04475 [Gemmatimonadales bacterium]|nr:hypothetical protein [Gemmatimonadales bacterium]
MIGCLTAPFRAVGCLVILTALAWGWWNRDRVMTEAHRLMDRAGIEAGTGTAKPASQSGSIGRPGQRARRSAEAKIDSLNGWRADSVVLSAAEVASLLGNGLDARLRKRLDSIRVELGEGEIVVNALFSTAALPRDMLGPLGGAVRPWEPVQVAGPVAVTRPERGEWTVRRFRVRDFPLPRELMGRLVGRATGDSVRQSIRFRIPPGVRDLHVHRSGATLYGSPPR